MKQGFIKVGAGTPDLKVADCVYNADRIIQLIQEMGQAGAKIMVLPELCITAYTCGDLFWQETLLLEAQEQLLRIARETGDVDALIFVGLPLEYGGKLYNVAAAVNRGSILGLVPKISIPNYNEFYEARYFTSGQCTEGNVVLDGQEIPFTPQQLFNCAQMPKLKVGVEICEDLWAPEPPSNRLVLAGANVVVNLSASDELVGKSDYRRDLVRGQSARLVCGYVYAAAGEGESTQDVVYGGHNMIGENGVLLAESRSFQNESIYGELDIFRLEGERRRMNTFPEGEDLYEAVEFDLELEETVLERSFSPDPFVPENNRDREQRCDEILNIQAMGLKKRLKHTGCRCAVVGLSGGLDSTLALLVTARAFDLLGISRDHILTVTMPCFGTTDRTYQNACSLSRCMGTQLREVNIREAVNIHFRDIGQDPDKHDVAYENSQARERTQILMDLANQRGGMVIGTGDLSELALGWATYNGDHMSMYGVNSSVPKTLVRHLVDYYADTCGDEELKGILKDVLDTPVSPELLPPTDGVISQKTEDLVGPYRLHDFFLYYMLRWGYAPRKIYRIACLAFDGIYEADTIKHWLQIFYRRFFTQQFKRSCLPDGPKVGSVAVSPRGDLRMPSDACGAAWLRDVAEI